MNRVTEKEAIIDNLLLLYLIRRVHEKSETYLGITKLQKLVFIAQKILNDKGMKAFNYDFFAWNYGPLSKEMYLDRENLIRNDILNHDENITLSRRGRKLLEDLREVFESNRDILEILDNVVEKFGNLDTNSLVQYVHDLTVKVQGCEDLIRIGSLNKGTDIIIKRDKQEIVKTFEINEPWIETLEILMDKEFCDAIKESEIDVREGRVLPLQEVL